MLACFLEQRLRGPADGIRRTGEAVHLVVRRRRRQALHPLPDIGGQGRLDLRKVPAR